MRYIGGKSLLLDDIGAAINENMENVNSAIDIFCGSGAVSQFFKHCGYRTYTNDYLYFCYVLQRGTTSLNRRPSFKKLGIKDPIKYLNQLEASDTGISLNDCFIYNNYAPNDHCKRMYFQPQNALKIDIIRLTIEKWHTQDLIDDNGYYYLLASLINAVPYVSNITGIYAAYLKFWDVRTYNKLELKDPKEEGLLFSNGQHNRSFNEDYHELLHLRSDLLYADPPYNEREYLPNYHVLETIARYDYPEIKGKTGMRDYRDMKSLFCSKKTVARAFEELIAESNSRYILISYNTEGIMPTEELSAICRQYALNNSFRLIQRDYRRYKNKIPNNAPGLREQLFFLQRR